MVNAATPPKAPRRPRETVDELHQSLLDLHAECERRGLRYCVVMKWIIDRWLADPVAPDDRFERDVMEQRAAGEGGNRDPANYRVEPVQPARHRKGVSIEIRERLRLELPLPGDRALASEVLPYIPDRHLAYVNMRSGSWPEFRWIKGTAIPGVSRGGKAPGTVERVAP